MFIAAIYLWCIFIVISVLSGWGWAVALRRMSASSASKEIALGLLLSGTTVVVVLYSITGGLMIEMAMYGPTLPWTVKIAAWCAPIWVGTFLLTRRTAGH